METARGSAERKCAKWMKEKKKKKKKRQAPNQTEIFI